MPYALISSDKTSLFACIPLRSQAKAVLAMIWIAMTAGNLCQGLEKLGEASMDGFNWFDIPRVQL